MGRLLKKDPAQTDAGRGKRNDLKLCSHFIVRNSCAASVKPSWLAKGFSPQTLTVFFKKLDPETIGVSSDHDNPNLVEFVDNTSGEKIQIDLMKVPEESVEASGLPNGIDHTVLLLKYLKSRSDDARQSPHRLDIKPGEVRAYDFDIHGAGTYLVFLGIGCEENQSEHWYFRRVQLSRHKSYEISFRQEAGKLSGVSRVRTISG